MYYKVLQYHGGERADGLQNTWLIPDGNEFGDAFWVKQDGTTVTIVNAPTQDDLQDVHPSVEFEETEQQEDDDGESDDGETTSTAAPTTAMDDGTTEAMDNGTATDGEDGDGGSPGLTAVAALAALALAALGLRRRER